MYNSHPSSAGMVNAQLQKEVTRPDPGPHVTLLIQNTKCLHRTRHRHLKARAARPRISSSNAASASVAVSVNCVLSQGGQTLTYHAIQSHITSGLK
jgi:hypothetical protein